jgi:hypothetical protein
MSDNLLDDYFSHPVLKVQLGGACDRTILRYCTEPDGLPYVTIRGRKFYPKDGVRAWLRRRVVTPNPTRKRNARPNARARHAEIAAV